VSSNPNITTNSAAASQGSATLAKPAPGNFLTHIQRDPEKELEDEKRPLDFRLILRIFSYTKPHAVKRNWLMLAVLFRSVSMPSLVALSSHIIGGPISHRDIIGLFIGVGLFATAHALNEIVLYFRVKLSLELGEAVVNDLRKQVFAHIHSLPMSYFNKTKLGRIISRTMSDTDLVRVGVQDVLFVSTVGVGRMVVAGAWMLYTDAMLFALVALMAPIIYFMNLYFRTRLSRAHRAVQESFSRVTATVAESVSGIRVTQGFVRESVNSEMFHDLVTDHSRYNVNLSLVHNRFMPLLEFNGQFFTALILVVGGYLVLQPHTTHDLVTLIAFFFLANEFFGPIPELGNQYNQALTAMAGGERVFKLLDTKPEFSDPPTAVALPIQGKVEFRRVTFGYNPAQPVLHDVSFTVNQGQTVALVGHTGSGKSSIINLISKFYLPTSGTLLIDGHDIREIQADSLHHQMGIVLQVNYLFSGTILDNIRVGRDGATDQETIDAARKLDCLDLLEALPEGLRTQVGERGASLSLGQRQLVCFARAMLADPRIMILDEATSSVDGMTEARIQKALSILLKGRTSFVVAHRLSTIRHADIVLVLDHGRIVERGTHRQLLATGGVYANLYRKFIRASEA
jgi:ATP-binding cassette, subfamily B, bacterial